MYVHAWVSHLHMRKRVEAQGHIGVCASVHLTCDPRANVSLLTL